MNDLAIVAIGYNRVNSMMRLLNSLKVAEYDDNNITLIVSIDNCGNDLVEKEVEAFYWPHGNKIIKTYEKRLGLRNHILKCGNLVNEYNNIAVFEDDIFVSPVFYKYAKQALKFYGDDDRIAGISLYNHKQNVNCNKNFDNLLDRYDNYFIKYAQSWGQIWSRDKWNKFIQWYKLNKEQDFSSEKIPKFVREWPESSWLKYHIKYLVETNRYFVYPKEALATNFTEVGQHAKIKSPAYQVNFQLDGLKTYKFAPFDNCNVKYDAFFENENIYKYIISTENITEKNLCVDTYGTKKNFDKKRYWLTMEQKNFKIIKKFSLSLKPVENNMIFDIEGDDIYLYDTYKECQNKFNNKVNIEIKRLVYDLKSITRNQLTLMCIYNYRILIEKYMKKIFKR